MAPVSTRDIGYFVDSQAWRRVLAWNSGFRSLPDPSGRNRLPRYRLPEGTKEKKPFGEIRPEAAGSGSLSA